MERLEPVYCGRISDKEKEMQRRALCRGKVTRKKMPTDDI